MQQKHALGGPSAACLLPHVAPLQQQLLAFLARDGLKARTPTPTATLTPAPTPTPYPYPYPYSLPVPLPYP